MTGITAAFRLAAPSTARSTGRLSLDPVAETAQRSVGSNCRADAGAEGVESGVSGGTLHDRLDLGPVLVVVAQGRKRDLRIPRLAVAEDQEASGGHALRQHIAAQGRGGQRREPRMQRGEDVFARGGHV